jgi:hypothetical protein
LSLGQPTNSRSRDCGKNHNRNDHPANVNF